MPVVDLRVSLLCTIGFLQLAQLGHAQQEIESAADMLPRSVVLYAESKALGPTVELVLEHPLRARIESLPAYAALMQSNPLKQMKAMVSLLEAGMGGRWPKVLSKLTAGGVAIALDAESEGVALLVRAADPAILQQLRDTVLPMIRGDRNNGASRAPIREGEYRGIPVFAIGDQIRVATSGSWLVVTNKTELGKQILDHYLDGPSRSLAEENPFQQAAEQVSRNATAWAYMDIAALRDSGRAKQLYSGRTDNPLTELLMGGITSNLRHTDFGILEMVVDSDALEISIRTPHQPEWAGEERGYYFGLNGQAQAPALLSVENQVFTASSYRDLSQMWLRAGDLMTDNAVEGLARADSQLTTFFSGKDFGEDILGALEPGLQFVVVRQDFTDMLPCPAITLPAFALKMRMNSPEETQPEFRRVFQSFIGFLNVIGAMKGQPQFDLELEDIRGQGDRAIQIVSARYVPQKGEEGATDAAINFNFAPALVFSGEDLILSSTRRLGRDLAIASSEVDVPKVNTVAKLDVQCLSSILSDNRQQLIAKNMLDKGYSQTAAEGETELILELTRFFTNVSVDLAASAGWLEFGLRVGIQNP